jgi:hypothetical protein
MCLVSIGFSVGVRVVLIVAYYTLITCLINPLDCALLHQVAAPETAAGVGQARGLIEGFDFPLFSVLK